MYLRLLYLVTLWCSVSANKPFNYKCSESAALALHKRPIYQFSMKLLQRVSEETQLHFVFSPLPTWTQVSALAEGATGLTYREIMNVTKLHRLRCYRKNLRHAFGRLNKYTKYQNKKRNIMAIDQMLGVQDSYIRQVQRMGINVMLLDFYASDKSAAMVNRAIHAVTRRADEPIVYASDFENRVLLMSDANYFRGDWASAFNSEYTQRMPFLSSEGVKIGEVNMMSKVDYFNMLEMPHIGAKVLELPCARQRISVLIFLPTNKTLKNWIGEIFYSLENTNLNSIFNLYKKHQRKLVNVSIPRIKQRTEVDNLGELLYDMGLSRSFDPRRAQFKRMSNYTVVASLVTQISEIYLNEAGVTARTDAVPEWIVRQEDIAEFNANKPFAYMIVDKVTSFILYAGVYSIPSVV